MYTNEIAITAFVLGMIVAFLLVYIFKDCVSRKKRHTSDTIEIEKESSKTTAVSVTTMPTLAEQIRVESVSSREGSFLVNITKELCGKYGVYHGQPVKTKDGREGIVAGVGSPMPQYEMGGYDPNSHFLTIWIWLEGDSQKVSQRGLSEIIAE